MTSLAQHLRLRLAVPRAELELRRLAAGDGPIVAGPWLSEVGFEVLYWLPFLEWFAERHRVDPARMTAVSRGGAGCWYGNVCGEVADVFDVFEPNDLQRWSAERQAADASQKQFSVHETDREVLRRALAGRVDPDQAGLLHPAAMYRLFAPVWDGWKPLSRIRGMTVNRALPRPGERAPGTEELGDYVAVKVYWSDCFPDTPANRDFVARLLAGLTEHHDVVLLSTGIRLDDHRDLDVAELPRVHTLESFMRPDNNLELQTRAIAHAGAFAGTYGGFSYLAPFLGVPSLAFYSEETFVPTHLDVMRRARSDLGAAGAAFVAQHVGELDLLGGLLGQAGARSET